MQRSSTASNIDKLPAKRVPRPAADKSSKRKDRLDEDRRRTPGALAETEPPRRSCRPLPIRPGPAHPGNLLSRRRAGILVPLLGRQSAAPAAKGGRQAAQGDEWTLLETTNETTITTPSATTVPRTCAPHGEYVTRRQHLLEFRREYARHLGAYRIV